MKELLVVIDMQNDFIDGALGTEEARKTVEPVCAKIRKFEGDVIYTRDTHGENYLNTQEGRSLPVKHCIKDTDGWQINSEVFAAGEGKTLCVVDKPVFASFELAEIAAIGRYEKITLIGVCTDICVVSNALLLKSKLSETPIAVIESLCAGVTPQSHKCAVETMKMCQIIVE
ncbi:cysteine hydrolase [Lachnospiraceae bacterium NSJ-143]|nr:cysteine hydrolase [Lachnospiraceae bacterium NSJ-143]